MGYYFVQWSNVWWEYIRWVKELPEVQIAHLARGQSSRGSRWPTASRAANTINTSCSRIVQFVAWISRYQKRLRIATERLLWNVQRLSLSRSYTFLERSLFSFWYANFLVNGFFSQNCADFYCIISSLFCIIFY